MDIFKKKKKKNSECSAPSPKNIFDIYNPYGVKVLRLGLSHFS